MPGQDVGAVVPSALLDLIALLPPSHEYVGPSVDVDDLMYCLHELELPGPPEQVTEFARPLATVTRSGAATIANAPSAGDIFMMRQQLKKK